MFHVKQSESEEHFVRIKNVHGIFRFVYMNSHFRLSRLSL